MTLLLAPTITSLNKMLDTCKQYADDINLTFNASKTKCMYFDYKGSTNNPNNIVFMHEPIEFVSSIQLLGINISTDIYDRQISDTVKHFIAVPMRFYLISALFLVILYQDFIYMGLAYGIIVRIELPICLLHGAKSCVDCGNYQTRYTAIFYREKKFFSNWDCS